MAGFSTSRTTGKHSTFAVQRQMRSTASLPKVWCSSSSSPSSSFSAAQASTSSPSCTMKWTQTSRACWMKPGTLTMALGLPSMKEMITSKAYFRASSSLCDLAMLLRSGRSWPSMEALKKSAVSAVACRDCSISFRSLGSLAPASCVSTATTSGTRGWKGLRSSFESMLSTRLHKSEAALVRTASAGSERQVCRIW